MCIGQCEERLPDSEVPVDRGRDQRLPRPSADITPGELSARPEECLFSASVTECFISQCLQEAPGLRGTFPRGRRVDNEWHEISNYLKLSTRIDEGDQLI